MFQAASATQRVPVRSAVVASACRASARGARSCFDAVRQPRRRQPARVAPPAMPRRDRQSDPSRSRRRRRRTGRTSRRPCRSPPPRQPTPAPAAGPRASRAVLAGTRACRAPRGPAAPRTAAHRRRPLAPEDLAGPAATGADRRHRARRRRAAGAAPCRTRTAAVSTVPFSSLTVRRYVEPEYPRNAAARRVPGWVDVAFTVDAPGGRGTCASSAPSRRACSTRRRWPRCAAGALRLGSCRRRERPVSSQIRVRFEPQ